MTKYANLLRSARRFGALAGVVAGLGVWTAGGLGGGALAEIASVAEALSEKSIGSADAPVVMHEYASLTCPHCATFHTETLPRIKADFVATGKLRIVFHDFPLDDLAQAAAMLARCAGNDRYFSFLDTLFTTQASWRDAESPLQALIGISRMVGLNESDVEACLNNNDMVWALIESTDAARENPGVKSTPTFFVDDQRINGNLPYDDFKDVLEKALAKKAGN